MENLKPYPEDASEPATEREDLALLGGSFMVTTLICGITLLSEAG